MQNNCDSTTPYHDAYKAISEQLYCPVCQGQSLASSQAQFAVLVRADICEMLHEGMSEEMIIDSIEQNYSTHMRYSAPSQSEMLPLMAGMGLLMAAAVWCVWRMLHRND
jgi:cytochrome c-type biogenesis protein CcmH/NrfF